MAQQVDVNVQIGDTRITHFRNLRITQDMHTHHTFEIVVAFEDLEEKTQFFFKGAHQALVGKGAAISFKPRYKNVTADFAFLGVVTELTLLNSSDTVNLYVIKGHSPTILLEDGQQRRTWIAAKLGGIFGTVANDYAGNLLNFNIAPNYTALIDYKAQYDESNWAFVTRMAQEYGEWCYYDGQALVIGKPGTATQNFVIDGVQHFDMAISIKPNKHQMHHYNYVQHKAFDAPHKPTSGLGVFGDFAYQQSSATFGNPAQLWPLKDVGSVGELDGHRGTLNSLNATNLVRFNGSGENPNMNVGVIVAVTGQKLVAPGKYKQESVGNYRITHMSHHVDEIGNYNNQFEAVPSSAGNPPHNPYVRQPVALPEVATVITNEDPLQLGRVKLQFHWPNRLAGKSSWVRVAFPYTGSDRGMLFIPEKDDQVLLSYEANHVDFPVVVGSLYHKSPATNYWFDNNERKFIRTKGGNKIMFYEKEGKQEIFISNANKEDTFIHISFAGDGTIKLETPGLIQLEAKNIKMHATEDITMDADRNIKITAKNDVGIEATNTMNQKATTIHVKGDSKIDMRAPDVDIYES